jgi:subtilisin family serine protease
LIYSFDNIEVKKLAAHILFLFVLGASLLAQVKEQTLYVENELYVKLAKVPSSASVQLIPNPDNPSEVKSVWNTIKAYGGESMINTFPGSTGNLKYVYRVKLKPGSNIDGLVKELRKSAQVEYAEKIPLIRLQYVPDDYDRDRQWCFKAINMSWGSYQSNPNHEINIAVIDNGVRYTHEDLMYKMMRGKPGQASEYGGQPGVDDDGNGYIDDIYGWDVSDNDNNPAPPEIGGSNINLIGCHGTHVAGIVAADPNNGIGITSLGVNNRILCVKAAKDEDIEKFYIRDYVEGIHYAIGKGVDIINCSWGLYGDYPPLHDAIKDALAKNIIVVAAAGNHDLSDPFYPAAYDGVIAVGSTDINDHLFESNHGDYIDVMAPGQNILSTVALSDHSYAPMSGTSMAAPLVSSLIGLTLSLNPDWRKNIEKVIKASCDNIDFKNPSYQGAMGAGRINVDNTLIYTDETTGIYAVSRNGDFSIYPNPASSTITLPFEELSPNGQPLVFNIYNVSGTQVSSIEISTANQRVDVSQLPTGIYNISTTTADNFYQTRLLVTR